MEIPHPHHITHRKKWGEYLLEFLMIFLAVFLGFIAENIREHIAERRHAEDYAKNFLIDLKNDVKDIDQAMRFDSLTNLMIDSLILFVNNVPLPKNAAYLYYLSHLANWTYTNDWNKATLNQLIFSGNLRYFTNENLVAKINYYNTLTSEISSIQELIRDQRNKGMVYGDDIFRSKYQMLISEFSMDDVLSGLKKGFIDSLENSEMPLQNSDPGLLNHFSNALMHTKGNRSFLLVQLYPKARQEAWEIMQLLINEYKLK